MPKLTINDIQVEVDDKSTLLDAINKAGIHIPTFCHHPRYPSHAVCRMCLVKVNNSDQWKAACKTPVNDGDIIVTDSDELVEFRKINVQWLLSNHPNDCIRCEVSGSCKLQSFVQEYQLEDGWPNHSHGSQNHSRYGITDHTSPSIWRDISKCIECGLCVEACGEQGQQQHVIGFADRGSERLPVTVFNQSLENTKCISCGQCTSVCPVGALIEKPDWHEVLHTLDSRREITVVQVAPATRVAIGEEFGMAPGTISTGKMINALRQLGFDYVFDTNFAADLTIMEEGAELLGRIKSNDNLPLFTSCCPGWVNWVEINRPDLLPHLSTTKSPQQMHGALTKRSMFVKNLGHEFASGEEEPVVVSIMPCTAKKDEAIRPEISGDIDYVLTTRELAKMIKTRDIHFASLSDDGAFDNPLGESTGAGQIFGATGGVMEAVVRTATYYLDHDESTSVEWHQLRGINQSIKVAEVPEVGKVAVCNGIASAQKLLETDGWKNEFVAIEVMACVGGCLGGGGEPKSSDPDVLQKRMQAIYSIDKNQSRRRSYQNKYVQKLYKNELKHPNSSEAQQLLHTSFASRNSKRLLLMKFLDCVDRRSVEKVPKILHPDVVWTTASDFGEIVGVSNIQSFIKNKLPPRKFGSQFSRHRMEKSSAIDDLTVIMPTGQRCKFDIQTETIKTEREKIMVIKKLTRIPL